MRPLSRMDSGQVLFIDDQQKNVDAVAEVCLTHKTRQNPVSRVIAIVPLPGWTQGPWVDHNGDGQHRAAGDCACMDKSASLPAKHLQQHKRASAAKSGVPAIMRGMRSM